MTDFLSIEKQVYVNRTMDLLFNEVNILREWFKKEYPESDLKIQVDLNKILLELHILIRVVTGKEMSSRKNQGFFECPIVIKERQFMKDSFMSPFLKEFNNTLRKNISRAVNTHLINERVLDV